MKVAVLGGTGAFGSALAARLMEAGMDVTSARATPTAPQPRLRKSEAREPRTQTPSPESISSARG